MRTMHLKSLIGLFPAFQRRLGSKNCAKKGVFSTEDSKYVVMNRFWVLSRLRRTEKAVQNC